MNDRPERPDDAQPPRLGEILLLAGLWMLFGFMLWYYLAAFHGAPARIASEAILGQLLGGDFHRIIPQPDQHAMFQVETTIRFTFRDGSTEALGFIINPLIYGYGLPLLFGLVMGTDVGWRRKVGILALGYAVIAGVQTWGVVFQSLKILAFDFGEQTRSIVLAHGIDETTVAIGYQLGSLILPALAPVVVWVLTNRPLVEQLVGWRVGEAGRGPGD